MTELTHATAVTQEPYPRPARWLRPWIRLDGWLAYVDGALIVGALLTATLLASAGAITRTLSLPSSAYFDLLPRYGTLVIGFAGAALATRSGEHIALDIVRRLIPNRFARWLRLYADVLACIVSALLALATWQLIQVEREAQTTILASIPSWLPLLFLLWGLSIAASRFALRAVNTFAGSLLLLPLLGVALYFASDAAPELLLWTVAAGLFFGVIFGAPLFVLLGGITLLLFWSDGAELAIVPIEIYRLTEAPSLVTLPLFTLLGAMLSASQAPHRLVRLARAMLGWLPGGLAIATVIVCAFFTTFTGASGVTILAVGLLLHQLLTREGYDDRFAVGLVTSSGSIGLMFAPALPLIVYGIVAKVPIDDMFIAGISPGILLTALVAFAAVMMARRTGLRRHAFSFTEAKQALRESVWDLMLPVSILGVLLSGLGTIAEAAAVGVIYCGLLVLVIHRDVKLRELPKIARDSGVLIGAVLVILGVALAFTYLLVDREVPAIAVAFARTHIESRWVFLLGLNLLLLGVGCMLDIFSALIIFVPLVMPVAVAFGVHPVHLGIIFLANLEIGYLTPPVGMNLFLASFRFKRGLPQIWRSVLPFLGVLLLALLVITFLPELSIWWLPGE